MAGAAGVGGEGVAMNVLLGNTAEGRVSDLESRPSSSSASEIRPAPGQGTAQFFQEINDCGNSLTEIQTKLQMLQNSNEDYRNVTRATAIKVIKEKMDKDLDEISVFAGELRGKLETLDRSNAANRKIMNCQAGSSTDRTRMSTTSNLKRRLRELTVDFQALGQRFQDGFREIVETRHFTATGQQVDESMIERVIETGDSEPIFHNAILAQGRGEVLDTIAEIQERHHAVKDIEKKLLELRQIFLDMGIVVEAQDEVPDSIEPEVALQVDLPVDLQVDLPVDHGHDYYLVCLCFCILASIIVIVILVFVSKKDTK